MATSKNRMFLKQFQTLFNLGVVQSLTDGQLLERFATGGGERAELAFAALVERHAPLVLRVCQAQLGDSPDAHDAFQATFLVLMKKARSLWVRDSIGPWLHQVAYRTASCARTTEARRRRLQRAVAIHESYEIPERLGWETALHDEVNRLPERYRVPIILCDLQGCSCEEAARRMGRPVGTVKSWRSRGRDRLRQRLIRLGVVPATLLSADVAKAGQQDVQAEIAVNAAVRKVTEGMTAGMVPAQVNRLVNGVLKAMILGKLRMTAVLLVATFSLAGGLGTLAAYELQDAKPAALASDEPTSKLTTPTDDRDHPWPLSLPEAIRIGLANSHVIRIQEPAQGDETRGVLRITPKDTDAEQYRFKSEIMAHVRSVEQQYWALQMQQAAYWSAETAVDLTEQIVRREQAKVQAGVGKLDDLKKATERLDLFRLDFVKKTGELITSERQLRNILGLPTVGKRIVPMTAPKQPGDTPLWKDCLETLQKNQPDLQRALAEAKSVQPLEPNSVKAARQQRQLQDHLDQAKSAALQMMYRMYTNQGLEYNHVKTANQSLASARKHLDAQSTEFENGRTTMDRYLDAVENWSLAEVQKAESLSRYNTAMAALEEAKGSLLETKGIVIADTPRSPAPQQDGAVEPTSLAPIRKPPVGPMLIAPTPPLSDRTFSFQLSIGSGPKPLEIRGSFTISGPPSPAAPFGIEQDSR